MVVLNVGVYINSYRIYSTPAFVNLQIIYLGIFGKMGMFSVCRKNRFSGAKKIRNLFRLRMLS